VESSLFSIDFGAAALVCLFTPNLPFFTRKKEDYLPGKITTNTALLLKLNIEGMKINLPLLMIGQFPPVNDVKKLDLGRRERT